MKARIGLIGYGAIGQEVERRVLQRGWTIPVIARTSGIYDAEGIKIDELSYWLEHFAKTDAAVLCIPTYDDGALAFSYIRSLVGNGIPVVTCEKGALGNYFPELKPWISNNSIGYSAVVGGGTRLLHWSRGRLSPETEEIHLVINGTLNYIFDGLSQGKALEEVVEEAVELGYAEPGAQEPVGMISTEAGSDVPMKTSVFINVCGLGEVRAKEIEVHDIGEEALRELVSGAALRRYIVSITREEKHEDALGGFRFKTDDWYISAGFKDRTHNPLFPQLIPPGVNNVALISGPAGVYTLTGPGAGPTPTVLGGIMWDLENLLE